MSVKTIAFAVLGTASLAAPAMAGTMTPPPAEPVIVVPAPARVTGDWTGVYGGVELGYADVSTSGAASVDGDGAIGGLVLGYDYDFGDWVVGAGLDYDWTDVELGGVKADNLARLKVRVGYDFGNGLLYGTAGAAKAFTDVAGDDTGYFAGIGYEHKLTEKVTVGGEVLYHQFDDFNGSGVDAEATTAQVKVNYRF